MKMFSSKGTGKPRKIIDLFKEFICFKFSGSPKGKEEGVVKKPKVVIQQTPFIPDPVRPTISLKQNKK